MAGEKEAQPRSGAAWAVVSVFFAIGGCSATINAFQGESGAIGSAIGFWLLAIGAWQLRRRRRARRVRGNASADNPAAPTAVSSNDAAAETAATTAPAPATAETGEDTSAPPVDRAHPLEQDPRSVWAYRRFIGGRDPRPITPAVAEAVLAALEPGDHIELIADAAVWKASTVEVALPKPRPRGNSGAVAVRTLRAWILADRSTAKITRIEGPVVQKKAAGTPREVAWPAIGWAAELVVKYWPITVKIFLDRLDSVEYRILEDGAGAYIRRLPEAPEVPPAPDPDSLTVAGPAVHVGLPTDWRSAEQIACAHMRAMGFTDARLTGGSRDGGVDVVSSAGVAQVKMMALPVGAPPVQQLRGSRPDVAAHLFYSTSGYTEPAKVAADQSGVLLFLIDGTGQVTAVNRAARMLLSSRAGSVEPDDRPDVHEYVDGVRKRIMDASEATDKHRAHEREKYRGQWARVAGYLMQAMKNISEDQTFDSVRSAVIHYHHAELLAAVYFRELGIPYPGGAGDRIPDSLDEFYS